MTLYLCIENQDCSQNKIILNKYFRIFVSSVHSIDFLDIICIKNAVFKFEFNEKYQNPISKKPIPYNFKNRSIIKKEVDKVLKLCVIEETKSEWSFPNFLINKKGTDEQGNQLKWH